MEIKTILVATDFSDDAKSATDFAADLARSLGSRLRLLHAYHIDLPAIYASYSGDFVIPNDILEPARQAAETSLGNLIKNLAGNDLDVQGRTVMEHPVQAILDEAERLPADLIVLGTRGLTGIKHVLLGSTAERIVRLATRPVITVKSGSRQHS